MSQCPLVETRVVPGRPGQDRDELDVVGVVDPAHCSHQDRPSHHDADSSEELEHPHQAVRSGPALPEGPGYDQRTDVEQQPGRGGDGGDDGVPPPLCCQALVVHSLPSTRLQVQPHQTRTEQASDHCRHDGYQVKPSSPPHCNTIIVLCRTGRSLL